MAEGRALYLAHCARCHGFFGERTPFPDLRRMTPETLADYQWGDRMMTFHHCVTCGSAVFAVYRGSNVDAIWLHASLCPTRKLASTDTTGRASRAAASNDTIPRIPRRCQRAGARV